MEVGVNNVLSDLEIEDYENRLRSGTLEESIS